MINILTYDETTTDITPDEHAMTLEDGTELFYRAWIPREPVRKALVIFHRGHEHSGRLKDVVRDLRLRDVAIFAWDARGHGYSEGPRGYAPSFSCTARDADEFIRHISHTHGIQIEDMVVLGHSVGAVTVALWIHDYAPRVRAMVLVTPALRVKLYVPFAKTALRVMQSILGKRRMFVSSYVKGHLLTHDPEQARRYDEDPLISRRIAVNVLLDLQDAARRLIADAGAIQTPALVLAGGADWVVDLRDEREFFDRLGSRVKRMHVFEGMYHDILHEKDRRGVVNEIRVFVRGAFAREQAAQETNRDANEGAHTKDEYRRLSAPLAVFAPKRLMFAMQRAFMKSTGRLSDGIRLGWRRGFDSGSSLEYVYENRARGKMLIGKIIDRAYLNSVGWAGIRRRKVNIEKLLREAIERVNESGEPVRILDVATGQGRYVLDTLASLNCRKATALLRDYEQANVDAGNAIAARLGIQGVRFERADAFDEASYDSLDPRPNIAIVSGLFELFGDNALARRCLEGIANAIEEHGYIIYTGQPWHPQIEMIARVLTNRDGKPWVMRRRTQIELDDLVREAGFEKIKTRVDKRGIFSVSLARFVVRPSGGSS
ncbi:MAG TPA: bifunctional alpha/beta hydrolase/class I SAM-dependent methyltransferase [Blastocatellia bacterium]|nr:bifunctional alpha/beta hydrolase/class I SAM-dependent methyltransferase [Blastocatellia bacterium]